MHPIDLQLLDILIEIRNEFVNYFGQSNQYGQLTQSYVQKTFTIFNLLISSNCVCDDESTVNKLPIISKMVSNTQNELIETQLNIQYLLLNRLVLEKPLAINDFSRYEIELVRFFNPNDINHSNVMKLLPSMQDLYYIIEHPREFYPFGLIKAYEILSMLIVLDGEFQAMSFTFRKLSVNELEDVIQATHQEGDDDDVVEAMWKYVIAHLNCYEIDVRNISREQISKIIVHLRKITRCCRSSDLRQTATEVFPTIIKYFKETEDLPLLIDFAELLLSLLRDDDAHVRNRISEILMDIIRENGNQNRFEKGRFSEKFFEFEFFAQISTIDMICNIDLFFFIFQLFLWLLSTIS